MLTQPQVYSRIALSPYLPVFPPHIADILALLSRPETDLDAISSAIDQDAALRDIILKNLNSNGFATHKHIASIKDAILFFGLTNARNIIIFFITHAFYPEARARDTQLFTLYRYWTHVLATAVAGEALAEQTGHEEPFLLFTYGLLHDIGILVLDACLPEEEEAIIARMRGGEPQLEAERNVLGGLTHEDVGGWLCKRDHFPADITCAVQHHHSPAHADNCPEVARLLAVANILGTEYVAHSMPVDVRIPMDLRLVHTLGLTESDVQRVREGMPARIRRFNEKPIGL